MPNNLFKVLIVGDVVGRPGRAACRGVIPIFIEHHNIDFVIVNGENMAGGSGLSPKGVNELFGSGVDIIVTGDHAFRRKEGLALYKENASILRPANYPSGVPGRGYGLYEKNGVRIAVINLLGRVFMPPIESPFLQVEEILKEIEGKVNLIIVDFHAEATSEKIAMGWFLDGKVSVVIGTHTHVQTADETVLPNGTAYITDIGMTGPFKSVLGREIKPVLTHFKTLMPAHFKVASDDVRLNGCIVEIDVPSGRALNIERVNYKML